MEQWSARDDAPNLRRPESSPVGWIALAIAIIAVGAGGYYYWQQEQPRAPAAEKPALRTEAAPKPDAEPAIRHPLDTAQSANRSLPTLENSDSMMREALSGLLGRRPFDEMVYPSQLIRRIVATVDNLPRETAPRRVMPLQPVPGTFVAARSGEAWSISPANAERYGPYVRVFEAFDSRALVRRYVEAYPLFQRAYEELGYPNRYFNDRLVEAIDDMLAAPELAGAIGVMQPKVLYQFTDPDLETRSAGQKVMLRMGSENAAKVKVKLRELRGELAAAGAAHK
jgi:hypothetical protein